MTQLPLIGVRVLDLSKVLAGPLCSMMLGVLGADVIKVERPGRGDDTRDWGPPFDDGGLSAYFLSTNRNKLSLSADFALDADRDTVVSLVRTAHVVVENFLPGSLERVGLSARALLAQNPELVWCTISGFGADSRRPGYDFVVQAESGWMAITGEPDGSPMKTGVALADLIAGKDATIAVLAALAGQARNVSIDRHITITLAESARAALLNVAQNAMVSGTPSRRWGNAHANLVPYQLFHAKDRALVIAAGNDAQWAACVRALGISSLERDTELATNAGRLAHRERVVAAFEQVLAQRTAAEWIALLEAARVPCGVVKSVLEAITDAGNASPLTGMPSSVGGRVRYVPPRLDEHGKLIRRMGWGAFSA
jgi:crotonobetainyl-CoA:carnitine CoA-transferase CaiB-like acyl-CoA transferase